MGTMYASQEERERIQSELKFRILNAISSGSFYMDKFLSLVDVVPSQETSSAAVECGPHPVLHLNPDFIRRHCERDEHLLMLVLHELLHIILGHSRLYPRPTPKDNIVFDAVINAMLCEQFSHPSYVEFFKRLNSAEAFPARLLRPPVGWPKCLRYAVDASEAEKMALEALYTRGSSVTYTELQKLLESNLPDVSPGEYVLLGDHSGRNHEGEWDSRAADDELFTQIMAGVVSQWSPYIGEKLRRSSGEFLHECLMPSAGTRKRDILIALRRLLEKAGIIQFGYQGSYSWRMATGSQVACNVLPNWRDRRVAAWAAINGEYPVLFEHRGERPRKRWMPDAVSHVYLDVSGSVSKELKWLTSALDPLEKEGLCRLYVFSTVVDVIRRGQLMHQRIKNTYGTDISCVYDHVLSMPRHKTPRKVVVLTDGYTGRPTREQAEGFARKSIKLYVGLFGRSTCDFLSPYAERIERLPALK